MQTLQRTPLLACQCIVEPQLVIAKYVSVKHGEMNVLAIRKFIPSWKYLSTYSRGICYVMQCLNQIHLSSISTHCQLDEVSFWWIVLGNLLPAWWDHGSLGSQQQTVIVVNVSTICMMVLCFMNVICWKWSYMIPAVHHNYQFSTNDSMLDSGKYHWSYSVELYCHPGISSGELCSYCHSFFSN